MDQNSNYNFGKEIFEKLSEIAERTAVIETKCDRTESEVEKIKNEYREQNRLIAVHIKGTRTNTERLEEEKTSRIKAEAEMEIKLRELESRIEPLETPGKAIKFIKNTAIYISAMIGAVTLIIQVISNLKK